MLEAQSTGKAVQRPQIKLSKKKKVLFTAVIFVVFLFLLEGSLRLIGVKPPEAGLPVGVGLYRPSNNSLGFGYTPGWDGMHAGGRVHINSAGWRGRDFAQAKPPGTFRILGIGDSFTFGKAVNDEDVFLAKLETILNSDCDPKFETLNAGHEGINTAAELQYFNEYNMIKLAPDVVVLGFTVSNDAELTPNRRAYRQRKRTASLPLRITESGLFRDLSEKTRIAGLMARGAEWASSKELSRINAEVILSNYE
ncbi:MAG TPA: SGNH/GDSL hydrolase family protein, partial [Blastocatellia bacterium]